MPRAHCLSDDELRAYVEGRLDGAALDEAAAHLDHCPRCESIARRLEAGGNTIERMLREPPTEVDDSSPASGREAAPDRVGDHELLGLLGEGGMGVVYRARHRKLNRVVALKMLRGAALATEEERRRFRAEAEAIARLAHPNIVQVFEVGEDRDAAGCPQPYFTLEYVEGGNLARRLDGRPQPPARAAAWLEAIARGVHHAHKAGVVHRDLKPSNVLLTADGTPKVCDFGVAKLLAGAEARTRTGALLGTPEYMAPEQGQGGAREVGPAADVYALGAILYAALTGRPPHQGAGPAETLMLAQSADPVPPRRLQPGVPRDLETICLKCLEKEPGRRYPTAEAVADELARFRAGEPIRARPLSAAGRAGRWCRRYPALAAALVVAALALLGGTAVSWFFALRANAEAGRARDIARRANERAYVSDMRLAQRAWEDDTPDRLRELLDTQGPERTGGADLRGFEWHYWCRRAHWGLQALPHPGPTFGVAYSPDGERLAVACDDPTVRVWDGRGGLRLALEGHAGRVYAVAFGPGGDRLASAGADRTVRVWDARQGGPPLLTLTGHEHHARGVAFSPDGGHVASAGRDGTVRVWDARHGGPALYTFRGHAGPVFGVAFSPDGRRLASCGEDRTVRTWDAADGGHALTLRGHETEVYAVAFSPDGARVASGGADGTVRLWDAAGGAPLLVQRAGLPVWGLAFAPDGERVASAGLDKTVKVWDARKAGPPLLTFRGHARVIWGLAFRPDGARIASAGEDEVVRVWDAHDDGETPPLVGHQSQVTCVALSPDGQRIASAAGDWDAPASRYVNGEVKLWDLDTGRLLRDLKGHPSGVTGVAFSPDGRRLASAGDVWDEEKKGYLGEVKIWDADSGEELAGWKGHDRAVLALAFSPDGRVLASAGFDGAVRLREVPGGREVLTLEGHTAGASGLAFSPDGRRLASVSFDKQARVWDARTGAEVYTLSPGGQLSGVAFSRDGRQLAVAGYDSRVTLWDAATGAPRLTLKGHTSGAISAAFSPDGTRLAVAGEDRTVRVWETQSGQELLILKGHTGIVRGVAFAPDGLRLVSGAWDKTVRVWDARPAANDSSFRETINP